ncbi:MAG: hypothetical protein M5R36_04950 [Deltaproteobacteria bacterium]|nr:hypothetical protein [Deltaproteobacteria bacterium]
MELISWATLLFFLAAIPAYWALPKRWRAGFFCVAGFTYYFISSPQSGVLTLIFLWVILLFQRMILAAETDRGRKRLLIVAAVICAGPMVFYKYRFSIFGGLPGFGWAVDLPLTVPVGISYFTFRALHFLIETRRGHIGRTSAIDFFYYITFIPTVVAGPIERFEPFQTQQKAQPDFDPDMFGEGLRRIAIGVVKKLVLADMFFGFITSFLKPGTNLTLGTAQIWICLHCYYAYLYMDFSGYSDIAIGVSRLFGFRIMENFNWPIFAHNIREFWRRWHISLTGWLTEYLYFSLGGSRKGEIRANINTMITMMVIALWHGSLLLQHYFIWGLYLGLGLVVFRQWLRVKNASSRSSAIHRRVGDAWSASS